MQIYKFNNVFDHIEISLMERYGNNPLYDNVLIVLGYNVLPSLNKLRDKLPNFKIIIYQLEQLFVENKSWVNKRCYDVLKSADEIWDYDEGNIIWMRENYRLDAKLKPMIYTESLKKIPTLVESECDIDILMYGYLHERRAKVLINLHHEAGTKYKIFDLYGIWGNDLDEYIKRSKIILNIHISEHSKQEQVRMYYPVINGRCVLSEKSPRNYMGDSIIEVPYGKLVSKSMEMLKSGEWLDIAYQSSEIYKNLAIKHKSPV